MKPIYDGHSTWYLLEQMQNDNLSEQGKIMLYRRFRELVDYLGIDFEVFVILSMPDTQHNFYHNQNISFQTNQ